jgi:hypothetical protein
VGRGKEGVAEPFPEGEGVDDVHPPDGRVAHCLAVVRLERGHDRFGVFVEGQGAIRKGGPQHIRKVVPACRVSIGLRMPW